MNSKFSGRSEVDSVRRSAREECAKRQYEHAKMQGDSKITYEQVYRKVDKRAEILDKKKDYK